MSREREELAEIIQDCGEYIPGSHADDYVNPMKAAEAIVAAGYHKQLVVTTEEDLGYLPLGSIASLPNGFPIHRRPDGNWYVTSHRYPLTTEELWDNTPAIDGQKRFTVLREGERK